MLMIRLQRIGRKNDPAFRMVVTIKTASPKAGTYVDLVGTYNPKTKAFTVAADRVKDWMSKGAQLSPSLSNLLVKKGIIEGKKIAVVSKKNLEKNVAKNAAAAEAAAAALAAKEAEEKAKAAEPVAPVEVEATPAEVETAADEVVAEETAPAEVAPVETAEAPAEEVVAA